LTGLVFFVEPSDGGTWVKWRESAAELAKDGGDLSALGPEPPADPWRIVPYAWLPDVDLQRKSDTDRVPYVQWKAEGFLLTTPGRAISKRVVLQKLSAMCDFFEIIACAYDRWRIEDLISMASDDGISLPELKPFGQGYQSMSPAIENFERMLLNGEIAHNGNPVLNMCASNAVTDSDAAGNRKLDKERATGRIDLIVAAVMAAGLISTAASEEKSFWETPHAPNPEIRTT
jgi:phage terminase large subunit-like protein